MSNARRIKEGVAILAAAWLGMSPLSSAMATDVTYAGWLDSIKFGGDLRLRHDRAFNTSGGNVANPSANSIDRDRERIRLRYGFNAKSGDITAIFRMSTSAGSAQTNPAAAPANGTSINGDALSANQTEDTAFSRKGLWVDLAYLKYQPVDQLTLMGGKMDNPFWDGWSSSLVFDPDLNPEGYAESANLPMGLYATAGQFSINEAGAFRDANPWMFAERVGMKGELPMDTRGQWSVTDYGFTHETLHSLGGDDKFGNQHVAKGAAANSDALLSSFNILQFDSKLMLHMMDMPVTLEGGYVRNTQESQNLSNDGNILGVTLGQASKAHTWEVAYYHKHLGVNAVVSDFTDDDFGYGGTNQAGHIVWAAYAPRDNVQLKATFYQTHLLDTYATVAHTRLTNPEYVSHLMLDIIVKF